MTNEAGTLTSQQRYLPFGGVRELPNYATTSQTTDLSYTGQRDLGMGLMDYHARFYSPLLGRFTQPDTITPDMTQGLNRYSYVRNNPVNLNDPTGHAWDDCSNVKGGYRCKIHMKHAGPAIAEGNRRAEAKKIAQDLATLTGDESDDLSSLLSAGGSKPQYSSIATTIEPDDIPWWLKFLSGIKIIWRNSPNFLWTETGRRILTIDAPHLGVRYWHINTDLKVLQFLNYANIEPVLRILGGIKIPIIVVPVMPFKNFFEEQQPIMG